MRRELPELSSQPVSGQVEKSSQIGGEMEFDLSVYIDRSPEDVFAFLRDKDKYPQEEGSPVLLLEKTTPGPHGVGTRYREVVQMLPFVKGEILSEVTHYEPGERLDEDWEGAGMEGHLGYLFVGEDRGTRLFQRETVKPRGWLRLAAPLIQLTLGRAIRNRLQDIKRILEDGWTPV
jgi:uncharacterized protein YndB with AHSA1/START domain